ncbi:hypothetical protein HPB48_019845 [Haemaphysalis longicornis]|uniref:Uncharacterized protein n=1 Tax=Haemaphysalis longicornis TaxID=44386 RepID=A0A9J6GJI0_HAELO|nr:hypothetical protein HPB48_019845 [Haemaphysalis longicornis]
MRIPFFFSQFFFRFPPADINIPYHCPFPNIDHPCSGYHDFVSCCEGALDERCGDPEAVDLMHDTAENVFGNVLSLTCGSYQRDSSDCRSLDVLPQGAANETVRRNFISPLKAIVRSLG